MMMQTEPHSFLFLLLHWFVSALALMATAYFVKGFKVENFTSALIAAAVIGFANMIIWPILIVLTLPINILTLGLFTFVVNGAVLKICAAFLKGFSIDSWWSAIIGALLLSLISMAFHFVLI
jgi:putative membrane protein